MTPLVQTVADVLAYMEPAEPNPSASPMVRMSLFRRLISSETALHQTVISLADQGVASATNFLTGIIIARACSKDELGLYMLGFSLVLFVTDMQTSLIATPYMVYAPRLNGRAYALYTGSTLIHQLVFCLLAMLGVLAGALAVTLGVGPHGLEPVLWALVIVIASIMLREFTRRICFARLKLKAVLVFDTCIAIGQIGGLLILSHFDMLSASRAYWVVGSVCGIAALVWLWSERAHYELRISESIADLRKNWILGKWIFASGIVWAVSMNLYPWLLAAFYGVASAGVWAACLGVASLGNPLVQGIQNLVGPKIANEYAAKGHRALHQLVLKITVTIATPMLTLCLAMFIWGGRLLTMLYGRQYAGNGLVVGILTLNLLVSVMAFSFSRGLFTIDRADIDFKVNFAALFVMVTLGLSLVRAFGPLGAAFGLVGAGIAASAVRAVAFLKHPALIPVGRR